MSLYKKLGILTFVLMIVSLTAGLSATPAQAEDKAQLIFALAQKLHAENVKVDGFTFWVGGNLGLPKNAQRPKGLVPGAAIPAFTLRDFYGKQTFTAKDLKGPYIMNFWASWCPPCRQEFPLFIDAQRDQKLTVPVYFVNTLETKKSEAEFFLLQYPKGILVLADPRSKFGTAIALNFIPVTILVDAEGQIQALQPGEISATGLEFFAAIAENPGLGAFDWRNPNKMPAAKK